MLTPKLERGYTSAQQWSPGRGGAIQLSEIKVRENETFESALRRFNKKIKQNGVLSEVRRREHYEKPSVKRKKKIAAARKRRARSAKERQRAGPRRELMNLRATRMGARKLSLVE